LGPAAIKTHKKALVLPLAEPNTVMCFSFLLFFSQKVKRKYYYYIIVIVIVIFIINKFKEKNDYY
jgi:ABC-type Fe3+ transport system permease subunit